MPQNLAAWSDRRLQGQSPRAATADRRRRPECVQPSRWTVDGLRHSDLSRRAGVLRTSLRSLIRVGLPPSGKRGSSAIATGLGKREIGVDPTQTSNAPRVDALQVDLIDEASCDVAKRASKTCSAQNGNNVSNALPPPALYDRVGLRHPAGAANSTPSPDPALNLTSCRESRTGGTGRRTAGTAWSLALPPFTGKGLGRSPSIGIFAAGPASYQGQLERSTHELILVDLNPMLNGEQSVRPAAPRVTLSPPERRECLCAQHPQWSVVC